MANKNITDKTNLILEKYTNIENIKFNLFNKFFLDFNDFKFKHYGNLDHYSENINETIEQSMLIYNHININELFNEKTLNGLIDKDIIDTIFKIFLLSEKILTTFSLHMEIQLEIQKDLEYRIKDFSKTFENHSIKRLIEDMIVFNNTKEFKKSMIETSTELVELEYTLMLYCIYIYYVINLEGR